MTTTAAEADLDLEERRLQARLDANLVAADEALKAATREPWVKGSTGQHRAHSGFAVAAKHDELALRFAKELRELRQRRKREAEDDRLRELTAG
jgi:hypothetical protein